MKRQHIVVNGEMHNKIKTAAAEAGQTIGIFVERAMTDWFAAQAPRTLVDPGVEYTTKES